MTEVVIAVQGTPAPHGLRPRRLKPWLEAVSTAAVSARARHLDGPLAVDAVFYLPRPRGHYGKGGTALRGDAPGYPHGGPQAAEYAGGLIGALAIAGVMDNGGQVVSLMARKRYAEFGTRPGAVVRVKQVKELW